MWAQDDTPSGAALDGYAPFYAANLAVPSFVKRDDKSAFYVTEAKAQKSSRSTSQAKSRH